MMYDQLPVYKATYNLTLLVYRSFNRWDRQYRYTLLEEIKNGLQKMLLCIYLANSTREKLPFISDAIVSLANSKLLFRLAIDLKLVSKGQATIITASLADISKQLSNWERYEKNRKTED